MAMNPTISKMLAAFSDSSRTAGVAIDLKFDSLGYPFILSKSGKREIYFDPRNGSFWVTREWGVSEYYLINLYNMY